MHKIYLALGSNVGDSKQHIAAAIKLLGDELCNIAFVHIYTSKAVGYSDQPDFLNTAIYAETELGPLALLKYVKSVEAHLGRISRFRWGPREIDIDIIFYDDVVQDSEVLTIPHPRFAERDFVLQPLCDLNPLLVDPLSKRTVSDLLAALPISELAILKQLE